MKLASLLLASLLLAACAGAPAPAAAPVAVQPELPPVVVTDEAVAAIETSLVLPAGASDLSEYDRYYAGARLGERAGVMIVLLARRLFADVDRSGLTPVEGRPNAYRGGVEALPAVDDGGCAVVTAYYDLEAQTFIDLHREDLNIERAPAVCNGVA